MLTIGSFDWRRLSPEASIEYRVDGTGALALRGIDPDAPPLAVARVRDGHSGFVSRAVEALGFVWERAKDNDGWILRTHGAPSTMAHVGDRWTDLVQRFADPANVDERLVLATIAAESGDSQPDDEGHVKAPRTERGYPARQGEHDPGDLDRDAEDWRASHGANSSHGLLQTVIGTAVAARPDLFAGVPVTDYRMVLWDPANSIACGTAHFGHFAPSERADPMVARVRYGAGGIRVEANVWGAHVYDDYAVLTFVAFWNDGACLNLGACDVPVSPPSPSPRFDATKAAWITIAFACFALSAVAGLLAVRAAEASRKEVPS